MLFQPAADILEYFLMVHLHQKLMPGTGVELALDVLHARILLPKLLGRRGKALVNMIDGWIAPKKA